MKYFTNKKTNKMHAVIFSLLLLLTSFSIELPVREVQAAASKLTNLVVFVNFSDTVHNHEESILYPGCYENNPQIDKFFNGSSLFSLKTYISNISYGALDVESVFPMYNSSTGKVSSIVLPGSTSYYTADYDNDYSLIVQDTITALQGQVSTSINLDQNGDGFVDNLMIIFPCENTSTTVTSNSNTAYGLTSSYYNAFINGVRVGNFTLIPEGSAYYGMQQSGVIIHEFMHTLGYPDLYRTRNTSSMVQPVGRWDIMSSASYCLQFPLAYLRQAVSGWVSLPTVTSSTSYTLTSATATIGNSANKNNQAVIIKTPYSDSEFFVVEYRQKSEHSDNYDYPDYGSGLIIYRVNTAVTDKKNTTYGPYYIYLFRPGDSRSSGIESCGGDLFSSYLSSESNRTSYGTSDMSKGLSDGAITYSDGQNSGIVISNVGSAEGSTISFNITVPVNNNYWDSYAINSSETISGLNTCSDNNGTLYSISALDYTNYLYKVNNGTISKLTTAPGNSSTYGYSLAYYNNKLYCLYVDSNAVLHLAYLNGSSWTDVYTNSSNTYSADIDLYSGTDGLYFAACTGDGFTNSVVAFKYNGAQTVQLGSTISNMKYAANPTILQNGSHIVMVFREAFNSNKIHFEEYTSGSWNDIVSSGVANDYPICSLDNDTLYYLGVSYTEGNTYLYSIDLSKSDKTITKLNKSAISSSSISSASMVIASGIPYIVYTESSASSTNHTKCIRYQNGSFSQFGNDITSEVSCGPELYCYNNTLYCMYVTTSNQLLTVRTKALSSASATSTPKPTATNTPTPMPTATNTPIPTLTDTPAPENTATPTPRAGYTLVSATAKVGEGKGSVYVSGTRYSTTEVTYSGNCKNGSTLYLWFIASADSEYNFTGWYSDEACTNLVSSASSYQISVNASKPSVTYYAKFEAKNPTNTPTPTATSTPKPTATSTPKPTATSTPLPTVTSTPLPTATSTPLPTATSTPKPTATSTPKPTATSTPKPTATSTPKPTATSTPKPTATSTPKPTATSTPKPTATNTPKPSEIATVTVSPTVTVTVTSTPTPTQVPTATPTHSPTSAVVNTQAPTATSTPTPTPYYAFYVVAHTASGNGSVQVSGGQENAFISATSGTRAFNNKNVTVTLTAKAASGHYFAGWYSDSDCSTLISSDSVCIIELTADNSVKNYYAKFIAFTSTPLPTSSIAENTTPTPKPTNIAAQATPTPTEAVQVTVGPTGEAGSITVAPTEIPGASPELTPTDAPEITEMPTPSPTPFFTYVISAQTALGDGNVQIKTSNDTSADSFVSTVSGVSDKETADISMVAIPLVGFVFDGWYTDITCTEKISDNPEITVSIGPDNNILMYFAKFDPEVTEPTPSPEAEITVSPTATPGATLTPEPTLAEVTNTPSPNATNMPTPTSVPENKKADNNTTIIILGLIVAFGLLALIIYFFFFWKRKDDENENN